MWCAASVAAACTLAAQAAPGLAAQVAPGLAAVGQPGPADRSSQTGPTIRLTATQHNVNGAQGRRRQVFLDPGVYVESLNSALQFDVGLPRYGGPQTLTQIIHLPNGSVVRRPLSATLLRRWDGLRHFLRITVINKAGQAVGSNVMPFCPDVFDPQRATLTSPATSPFPQNGCFANPFTTGAVWGVQRGWGVNPAEFAAPSFRLRLGTYRLTVAITTLYRRLLHISAADAVVHLRLTVTKGGGPCCGNRAHRRHGSTGSLAPLPRVPYLASPPRSELPDLVALPASGISVQHLRNGSKKPGSDQLAFGATVWIGGNSPLDVEGFRSGTSPIMKAYQYFYRNGRVVGRARAGTMGFDNKPGHNHWHFEQFAQYRLLNSARSLVLRSQKVGFCIAPTDAIDMVLRAAVWQPPNTGFFGACGSPTALWVREMLPTGWGDTYFQFLAGQSFAITSLPNGKYYIELIANPGRVLHESNTRNDISLRAVILGGTPGHRTVRVPAWHGIDPEGHQKA
jgi:hypothetical protein